MIATAPTAVPTRTAQGKRDGASPDLAHFRQRYPQLVANFGSLTHREEALRRIWQLETAWQAAFETHAGRTPGREVIVRGAAPAALAAEGDFDIIYMGGTFGLIHAAVMACRYGKRVLVFDSNAVGVTERDWNTSGDELRELERTGLFTPEEVESAVVNRYRAGFVKFHDAASRVKADPLWMSGVLDVVVDSNKLLGMAAAKLNKTGPEGCALMGRLRFVRAYVEEQRVSVEVEDARGARKLFRAPLFIDTTGASSAVARQINEGRSMTHVCPMVGTTARGFQRGQESNRVDFSVGEILVSTEDARDHRQLIWGGLAASPARDEYTTYLFFHDTVASPADKSLLSLFERYFETLPGYKTRGAQWRVQKPVFGYVPSLQTQGWRSRKRVSADRVLLFGETVGLSSPLAFGGFGSHVRNLNRSTQLLQQVLDEGRADAESLSAVVSDESRISQAASLTELLRPSARSHPPAVNETLNALTGALHHLDERVRRELFQDRLSFSALRSLLGQTVKLYPRIFARVREHFGARGTFWWMTGIAEAIWSERGRRSEETAEATDGEEKEHE